MFLKNKLKDCREEKKFSVESLMVGLSELGMRVSCSTIRNWESGECEPTASNLQKIAQFFKKPISFFYDSN